MAKLNNSETENTSTFEDALAELQNIVTELEDGTIGLAESIARFEHGMTLLRRCYGTLEAAEQKIELLKGFDAEGNTLTADFDAAATADNATKAVGTRSRRKKSTTPKLPDTDDDNDDEPPGERLF